MPITKSTEWEEEKSPNGEGIEKVRKGGESHTETPGSPGRGPGGFLQGNSDERKLLGQKGQTRKNKMVKDRY